MEGHVPTPAVHFSKLNSKERDFVVISLPYRPILGDLKQMVWPVFLSRSNEELDGKKPMVLRSEGHDYVSNRVTTGALSPSISTIDGTRVSQLSGHSSWKPSIKSSVSLAR